MTEGDEGGRRRGSIASRVASFAFGVIAVLAAFGATLAMTARDTVLDTDDFVALVGPLVDDPAVRAAISGELTDQALAALDLDQRVPAALGSIGPRMQLLAPPIVTASERFVDDAVAGVIDSDEFATLWDESLRLGHTRLIALAEGDEAAMGNLTVGEATVDLDLLGVTTAVVRRVVEGLGELLGTDIELREPPANADRRQRIDTLAGVLRVDLPDDYALMTVMTTDDLSTLQRVYDFVRRLGSQLVLLAIVAGALAIWLASDRRRAVIWMALGVVAAVAVTGIVARAASARLVDGIADPEAKEAARVVVATLNDPLQTAGRWLAGLGLATAFVAYLYGPRPMVERLSRYVRPDAAQPAL